MIFTSADDVKSFISDYINRRNVDAEGKLDLFIQQAYERLKSFDFPFFYKTCVVDISDEMLNQNEQVGKGEIPLWLLEVNLFNKTEIKEEILDIQEVYYREGGRDFASEKFQGVGYYDVKFKNLSKQAGQVFLPSVMFKRSGMFYYPKYGWISHLRELVKFKEAEEELEAKVIDFPYFPIWVDLGFEVDEARFYSSDGTMVDMIKDKIELVEAYKISKDRNYHSVEGIKFLKQKTLAGKNFTLYFSLHYQRTSYFPSTIGSISFIQGQNEIENMRIAIWEANLGGSEKLFVSIRGPAGVVRDFVLDLPSSLTGGRAFQFILTFRPNGQLLEVALYDFITGSFILTSSFWRPLFFRKFDGIKIRLLNLSETLWEQAFFEHFIDTIGISQIQMFWKEGAVWREWNESGLNPTRRTFPTLSPREETRWKKLEFKNVENEGERKNMPVLFFYVEDKTGGGGEIFWRSDLIDKGKVLRISGIPQSNFQLQIKGKIVPKYWYDCHPLLERADILAKATYVEVLKYLNEVELARVYEEELSKEVLLLIQKEKDIYYSGYQELRFKDYFTARETWD